MKTVPLPPNEAERQKLIRHLEMLDMAPADFFEEITRVVALICDAPVVLVCLTDAYQRWFRLKPGVGLDERQFCARFLAREEFTTVSDTWRDERLRALPAVGSGLGIRFFAGVPLRFSTEICMGMLCVVDYRPRILDDRQIALLKLLADHVVTLIKLRLGKLEDHRDFGELAISKQRLQYQKELLEAVLDNEPECVLILSRDGELVQVNHAGMDMLEIKSAEDVQRRRLDEFVQPEFQEAYAAMLSEVFRGEHITAEFRVTGAGGTTRWMESHAAPLRNQNGEIVSLVAIMRDVTQAKVSHRQLMLAARVFTGAQEGIIITDAAGTIVDVNPAFCQITGYGREEILGQNPRILQSGRQGPDFYAEMWKTLAISGRWKGEIWNKKKNGELYAELISINALRDDTGAVVNYVALFLDITEVKQRQEL